MELKECQNIIGSCACKKQQEKIHIGTKRKIDFISSYTQSWSNKVLRYKPKYGRQSDGIVFIDCMSNSGLYCFQEEIIDGTSKRIQKIFDGQSKREYEDKDFILVVNDREIDKINCQYCIWDNSYSKRTNYEKRIFNKDVDDFLKTDGLNLLDEAKRKNYHILLFYDPYDIRFNWKFLKPFLEYPKCDVIITHFWSNDTIRAVGQVTKKDVKDKYEMAYNVKFEILENYFLDKSFYEKAQYLRERFVSVIKEMAPRKHVGYAPI
ncbi:MAG TPA: hypothetical protein GX525_05930, partial [Bacilli bacterium]|nr:hypothetical protein [Bacilli bacterium]